MLNNEKASQLAWVTPCLDRIRCGSWWSVIDDFGALVLPDRSLIVGCVCVNGWGMNQPLSLTVGMGVGLSLMWVKLYPLQGLWSIAIAALSDSEHALWGSHHCKVSWWVHGRLISSCIWSLYLCNCIDVWLRDYRCSSFPYHNLIKDRYLFAK